MILKRYGETYHSVETNFESKALTEIGFRRDRSRSIPAEELETEWTRVDGHELTARAEGDVQDHTEQAMLDDLEARLDELTAGLSAGEVLVVENDARDYPKTRCTQKSVVVDGENRLRFTVGVRPPLKVAVYRPGS